MDVDELDLWLAMTCDKCDVLSSRMSAAASCSVASRQCHPSKFRVIESRVEIGHYVTPRQENGSSSERKYSWCHSMTLALLLLLPWCFSFWWRTDKDLNWFLPYYWRKCISSIMYGPFLPWLQTHPKQPRIDEEYRFIPPQFSTSASYSWSFDVVAGVQRHCMQRFSVVVLMLLLSVVYRQPIWMTTGTFSLSTASPVATRRPSSLSTKARVRTRYSYVRVIGSILYFVRCPFT